MATALNSKTIEEVADILERARREAVAIAKVTNDYPDLTLEDAFTVQKTIRERRIREGRRLVGFKMGLTSFAKMKQMGLNSPVSGFLLEDFAVLEGSDVGIEDLIHPKVEPEIAFVTKAPISGPGCMVSAVLAATDFIMPAIEIIDSRFEGYKFDLPSVVADNCSSARFALGASAASPVGLDLRTLGVVLEKNGAVAACGAGAAVLGNPAASVAALANQLHAQGEVIPAGAVILTGGITEAITISPGDSFRLSIHGLGGLSLRFH